MCLDSVGLFLFIPEVSSGQSPIPEVVEVVCPTLEDTLEQTCSFSWALQFLPERNASKESRGCCVSQLAVTRRVNKSFAKLHF